MYLINQDHVFLYVKCEKCGKEHRIQKINATDFDNGAYLAFDPISCSCGNSSKFIDNKKPSIPKVKQTTPPVNNEPVSCPKCGSTQISANKKGFGLGKAAVGGVALTAIGGVALGGIGLLSGFAGKNKVEITCLKCGHRFMAGKK